MLLGGDHTKGCKAEFNGLRVSVVPTDFFFSKPLCIPCLKHLQENLQQQGLACPPADLSPHGGENTECNLSAKHAWHWRKAFGYPSLLDSRGGRCLITALSLETLHGMELTSCDRQEQGPATATNKNVCMC